MDYEILSDDNVPIVTVVVYTDVSKVLASKFAKAAVEEAIRLGRTYLLFDFRKVRSTDDELSKYEFAKEMNDSAIPRHFHYAVVTAPDDISHDFAETTILNRGFMVRFFKDIDKAQGWLLHSSENENK